MVRRSVRCSARRRERHLSTLRARPSSAHTARGGHVVRGRGRARGARQRCRVAGARHSLRCRRQRSALHPRDRRAGAGVCGVRRRCARGASTYRNQQRSSALPHRTRQGRQRGERSAHAAGHAAPGPQERQQSPRSRGRGRPGDLASARRSIPLTTRTLDRAVSVLDYEDFARGFQGSRRLRPRCSSCSRGARS